MAPPHVAIGNLMCLPAVDTRLHLSALVACNRTRKGASAGHLMRTVPMFASPAVHTRRAASAAQLREKYFGIRQFSSRDLAVQRDDHHPCWKAAHFLPCTRPPDVMRHLSRPQRRGTFGPSQRRAFVATRSGLQTMPSGGLENDEDTAAAASFGDVRPPVPPAQSVVRPRDLQTALAAPADDAYGTKVFDNLGLGDFTPPQHWLWKTLKNATRSFGPLLKVFATEYDATTTCGTDAWESIFPLFPPALTLTLPLLVSVSCFVGERTRTSYTEDCLYGGVFVFLSLYISFGTRSTSLRYQMVDAHFYLEIITPSTLCDV